MSATAEFLSKAAAAFNNKQGDVLSGLLLPDIDGPEVELITEELLPVCQTIMIHKTSREFKQRLRRS